jgi:hypothetical protein
MIDNTYSQVDQKVCSRYNTPMKVIKLNRRYQIFKEHGYQAGLRFDTYNNTARSIEKTCRERLGPGRARSTSWQEASLCVLDSNWTGYFGKRNVHGPTPYFVMFQKESDLSFVLLCTDLPKNH